MGDRPGHPPLHYEPPHASKRQRVLVVDDHVPMAVAVARLIQVMGHEARITHDGATALSCLGGYCPDIILLDIGLPGMNGYEVALLGEGPATARSVSARRAERRWEDARAPRQARRSRRA